MKNKIISIIIIYLFLFTSLISVGAAAPSPRVDLDDYEINSTNKDNIYVSGTVNMAKGQNIGLFDSTGKIPLNYTTVKNTDSAVSFKIQVPSVFLNEGTNTFKVISLPVRGMLNASNPKTFTVKIGNLKKDQVITVSNISLKVNEIKNLNAKVDSNLPLTYVSSNPTIATVDSKGNVAGRKEGTTNITITQAGNSSYNSVTKTISVTVTKKVTTSKKTQSLKCIRSYQFFDVNKTYKLNAKVNTKLPLTYKTSNKNIVAVDSKGKLTSKKPGTAIITITQKGNNKYKPITKKVTVKVPKIKDRRSALKPWYEAMKTQADWTQGVPYGISTKNSSSNKPYPTIANSKKRASCHVFPAVSLQRLKLIKEGRYIAGAYTSYDGRYAECMSMSKTTCKSVNSNYIKCTTISSNSTKVKTLIKEGTIKPGDILGTTRHTCVYYGKDKNGNNLYSEGGQMKQDHINNVIIGHRNSTNDNDKIKVIASINTFDVKTSCENGTITMSNKYMAGQTVTITYKSVSKGGKLTKLSIDGKVIKPKNYRTSYTFKNLDKNHTVKVIYD